MILFSCQTTKRRFKWAKINLESDEYKGAGLRKDCSSTTISMFGTFESYARVELAILI